jgi:hypothetical protein
MICHIGVMSKSGGAVTAPVAVRVGSIRFLVILSALMAFASISTDIYLPALPALSIALHTDPGSIQMTLSGFLVGFSLGQLLWCCSSSARPAARCRARRGR